MYNSKYKRSDKHIRLRKNVFSASILKRMKLCEFLGELIFDLTISMFSFFFTLNK